MSTDYKAEAAEYRTLANDPDACKSSARNEGRVLDACRIAAAVYEAKARAVAAGGDGKDWLVEDVLDHIIAAGEGAACGEVEPSEAPAPLPLEAAEIKPSSRPSPAPSPKAAHEYREGDTLPKELVAEPGHFCGRSPRQSGFACTRWRGHEDSLHLATTPSDRVLVCDPYGDDGQPWVEPAPTGCDGEAAHPDCEVCGHLVRSPSPRRKVELGEDTVLALAKELDYYGRAARLLRRDAGEGA